MFPRKCRSQHGPARLHLSAMSRQVILESWPQYCKSEDMNPNMRLSGTKHECEHSEVGRTKVYCVEAKLCGCSAMSAEKAELDRPGGAGERAGQSATSSEGSVSSTGSSHVTRM